MNAIQINAAIRDLYRAGFRIDWQNSQPPDFLVIDGDGTVVGTCIAEALPALAQKITAGEVPAVVAR